MVTAKNLIQNSKTDLGWDNQDAEYTAWRNNVKDYCVQHNILSKTKAGEDKWQQCLTAIQSLDGFKPAVRARISAGSAFHLKALEALLVDTLKKRSETTKKLAIKRASKRPRIDESSDEEGQDSTPGNAVAIWLVDPCLAAHKRNGHWIWDDKARRKLGVVLDRSLDRVWQAAKTYIPQGQSIREILGALEDPTAANPSIPADWTSLKTDAEVAAFLKMTYANPIRLLLVLHHNDARPDTPLPDAGDKYFPEDHFTPEMYDDPCEDSDAIVRNAAGVAARRMPTKDHTFEERKYRIRKRIRRQEELLRKVEASHREKFPNVGIIDSTHEDYCYIRMLTNPVPKTGAQLILARQVIPTGRRAMRLSLALRAPRLRSKLRGIRAAQFQWEQLNE